MVMHSVLSTFGILYQNTAVSTITLVLLYNAKNTFPAYM